ncbi:MAG TPA: exosporium glycoprotein BclB-related protein [Dyadobacter sp.]|nr:exosporium glycoprotein BclB-related protein [Dyadobacter sp.]
MKRPYNVLLTALFALFAFAANAQVGIGTITPAPSAQLDIQATNKGLLIPRITEASRLLILAPATGLLVYQTDGAAGFYYFDGAGWLPLKSTAGGSAIVPFASGTPITLTTLIGGITGTGSALGFGSSLDGISLSVPFIDGSLLTGNMAFSVPRNGVVTSISAYFNTTVALNLLVGSLNITAQIYSAPAGTNLFMPLPGGVVSFSPLTGVIAIGTIVQGTASLAIPVNAGDRLMVVYSCTNPGGIILLSAVGHASSGIAIN